MLTMITGDTDEASALGVSSFVWWHWAILGLLAAALLAALIWVIVGWRRKHKAATPPASAGPSVASRLSRLWVPFYRWIPARALHFPAVVVMGSAGVGKTHAITCHVDWRGQANQFRSSVDHDAALQLYLGPDIIVHELSGPLLRDVSRRARRALRRLWRRMGPSATVVFVVDARTLLTTPPAALRELAQLVRGKISLFPRRCRTSLAVRVLLSHVDQVDGYETFAAAVGSEHPALELERLGPDLSDAEGLIAGFDMHLAYALTTRSGEEFDRMVRFYGALRELLTGLRPLLVTLQGRDEPHAEPLRTDGLYLGSLAPRSHVGKPFLVTRDVISASIGRQHQRGLRAVAAIAASGSALVVALMGWHLMRIQDAEAQFKEFKRQLPKEPAFSPIADGATGCAETRITERQTSAANEEALAIKAVKDSEYPWLVNTFVPRKVAIEEQFEEAIRKTYLYPQIPCSDRVRLLFLMALIYSSRDNNLGMVITRERKLWARELGLSEWVIEYYVAASSSDMTDVMPVEPEEDSPKWKTGSEWSEFLRLLQEREKAETITLVEFKDLAERFGQLSLRRPEEYAVLAEISQIFKDESTLPGRFHHKLVREPLDIWLDEQYQTLQALTVALREHLELVDRDTRGWGLADLVTALSIHPPKISRDFRITIGGEVKVLSGPKLSALFKRSNSKQLLQQVLGEIPVERLSNGQAFFSESDTPSQAGVVVGYGGGPTTVIRGYYTKRAYEQRVAPVLRFAAKQLAPASIEGAIEKDVPTIHGMTIEDAHTLDRTIREVTQAYAVAYHRELVDYYLSMEIDATAEHTFPFVFKAFSRSSSWFIDYLKAVTANAALDLAPDEPYVAPLIEAIASFKPLVALMAEKDGEIPGLAPYQALLEKLQPVLMGSAESPEGTELRQRLTPLGALTLKTLQTPGDGLEEQVVQWLADAGLASEWHAPFLAPVQEAHTLGIRNIESEVSRAWTSDVRPIVRPLLRDYPFSPLAATEVDIDDLEAVVRAQGKERGAFWVAFDRLIAPATVRAGGERMMLAELMDRPGMLAMTHDLERTSRTLWDADGLRAPLKVTFAPLALSKEPHEERLASMAHLRTSGAAVYGFNQRPEPQPVEVQWWNQGSSVVSLEMRRGSGDADTRTYTIDEDGTFSFYRLLDQGENEKSNDRRFRLTAMAIARATGCNPGEVRGSKSMTVRWRVNVGELTTANRSVRMVLMSDPWLPFAVRDCG